MRIFFILAIGLAAYLPSAQTHAQELVGFERSSFGQVVLNRKQAAGTDNIELELAIGQYNNEFITNYSKSSVFSQMGRSVGRLDILTDAGVFPCTAFIVSEKYILTNYHCVPGILDNERSKATRIEAVQFIAGYTQQGVEEDTRSYTVSAKPIEAHRDLDYSVLEIFGNPSSEFGLLELSNHLPNDADPYWVIGHPLGEAQRISREKCRANRPAISGKRLLHTCDTLPGNSGSPVIDASLRMVVGLHHAGSTRNSVNFAIPMREILARSEVLVASVSPFPSPNLFRRPWCEDVDLNETETAICNSDFLAALDEEMENVLNRQKNRPTIAQQNEWKDNVRDICGSAVECISERTILRIVELKSSNDVKYVNQLTNNGFGPIKTEGTRYSAALMEELFPGHVIRENGKVYDGDQWYVEEYNVSDVSIYSSKKDIADGLLPVAMLNRDDSGIITEIEIYSSDVFDDRDMIPGGSAYSFEEGKPHFDRCEISEVHAEPIPFCRRNDAPNLGYWVSFVGRDFLKTHVIGDAFTPAPESKITSIVWTKPGQVTPNSLQAIQRQAAELMHSIQTDTLAEANEHLQSAKTPHEAYRPMAGLLQHSLRLQGCSIASNKRLSPSTADGQFGPASSHGLARYNEAIQGQTSCKPLRQLDQIGSKEREATEDFLTNVWLPDALYNVSEIAACLDYISKPICGCSADPKFEANGSICVQKTCPPDERLNQRGNCYKPLACSGGKVASGGKCVCPSGHRENSKGVCYKPQSSNIPAGCFPWRGEIECPK